MRPPSHRPAHQATRSEQKREHDVRRGSARERGYTRAWDKAAVLYRMEHPLCLGCEAIDRLQPSTVVDHIVPHKGDRELFWNVENWQASCDWHHDVIKQLLEILYQRGKINATQLRLDSDKAREMAEGGGGPILGTDGTGTGSLRRF